MGDNIAQILDELSDTTVEELLDDDSLDNGKNETNWGLTSIQEHQLERDTLMGKASKQGYDAYKNGIPRSDLHNPYDQTKQPGQWEAWLNGWEMAKWGI